MTICPKSFQPLPEWYIAMSMTIASVTIPLSLYTLFLMIILTPPHTDKYYRAYLILYHVVACFFSTFNGLSTVIQYMPDFLIVQGGISIFNCVNAIFINLISQMDVTILAGLVIYHRFTIFLFGDRHQLFFRLSYYSFFAITTLPTTILFIWMLINNQDKQRNPQLLVDCPHLIELNKYDYAFTDDEVLIGYVIYGLIFPTVVGACVIVPLFGTFSWMMVKRKSYISPATHKLQMKLLKNTIIQCTFPTMCHAFPAMAAEVIFFFKVEVHLYVSLSIWGAGTLHGILNCVLLLFHNEFYNRKMKRDMIQLISLMKSFFYKKNRTTAVECADRLKSLTKG
ncbi:unnamed protein product [Auanema sp. JU1783]|nr:unnamed protein product [Auanema sp. JU1783]